MAKIKRQVGLEGIRFVSPIGFFEEERILKNEFLVNISVTFEIDDLHNNNDDLGNTVDYSQLYAICEYYFKKEYKLIESVAHEILNNIKANYPFIDIIHLRINKLNPPIKAEIRNSFVELSYSK